MEDRKQRDNLRALAAAGDKDEKERFLYEEQEHILCLTARILKRTVTDSDEEYSIALLAVSEAISSFDDSKGAFWNYASMVIKRRLIDNIRSKSGQRAEITVAPEVFSGELKDDTDSAQISISRQVAVKTAKYVDTGLRDEIEALTRELSEYGIDLFDLPANSPKSEKTKASCKNLLKAFFTPPPLTGELKKTHLLPIKEMVKRSGESRKLAERYRKYLVAAALIRSGDYEGIGTYIPLGN